MLSGNPCPLTEPEMSAADRLSATLGSGEDPSKLPTLTTTTRHKCPACFKQYKKKEHLIEHIRISYHSVHDPKCGVCKNHCKSFESLREHILGPLSKVNCSRIFAERGCSLCLKLLDCSDSLSQHREMCCLSPPAPIGTMGVPFIESQVDNSVLNDRDEYGSIGREAIAIGCAIVGGGSDGSLDLCVRVCLVDEDEKIVFHTYVAPQISITDYRYEITGITEENMRDAMQLEEVRDKILQILHNGEAICKVRFDGGRAKALVGHNLTQFLHCIGIYYPDHLLRDTSKYRPLTKTNFVSHSLKYLTKIYLGQVTSLVNYMLNNYIWMLKYDIHCGVHDPYQDSVTAMKLYKRMRSQDHRTDDIVAKLSLSFNAYTSKQLGSMTPYELLEMSKSKYMCWCLDSGRLM